MGVRRNKGNIRCDYFVNGVAVRRWVKPDTIVQAVCKSCGAGTYSESRNAQDCLCAKCSIEKEGIGWEL
jgi:hypothetical protein